jgi:hypothetical protein
MFAFVVANTSTHQLSTNITTITCSFFIAFTISDSDAINHANPYSIRAANYSDTFFITFVNAITKSYFVACSTNCNAHQYSNCIPNNTNSVS